MEHRCDKTQAEETKEKDGKKNTWGHYKKHHSLHSLEEIIKNRKQPKTVSVKQKPDFLQITINSLIGWHLLLRGKTGTDFLCNTVVYSQW